MGRSTAEDGDGTGFLVPRGMVGTTRGRNLDQTVAARGYEAQPSPAKQSQGETADAWVCTSFRKEIWQIIQVSKFVVGYSDWAIRAE